MFNILYYCFIFPFEFIFQSVLIVLMNIVPVVWTLPLLSAILTLLSAPIFAWASKIEAKEKTLKAEVNIEIDEIKKQYSGEALFYKTEEVYNKFGYNPLLAFRESMTLFVLIPLFTAAYLVLNHNQAFIEVSVLGIASLSQPDMLLGGYNLLPFVMTTANFFSIWIETYPKSLFAKDNIKLLILALIFLIWLYNSSAALLIYWTCNNLFYIIRTLFFKKLGKIYR